MAAAHSTEPLPEKDSAGLLWKISGQYVRLEPYTRPPPSDAEKKERLSSGGDEPTPGLDATLPTGLLEEQARAMVERILQLAEDEQLVVFDPQLGRSVRSADSEIIVNRWKQQNDYLLKTVGSNGSTLGGGAHYPEYSSGLSPKAKFWLFVGALFVVFIVLARFCT